MFVLAAREKGSEKWATVVEVQVGLHSRARDQGVASLFPRRERKRALMGATIHIEMHSHLEVSAWKGIQILSGCGWKAPLPVPSASRDEVNTTYAPARTALLILILHNYHHFPAHLLGQK